MDKCFFRLNADRCSDRVVGLLCHGLGWSVGLGKGFNVGCARSGNSGEMTGRCMLP